MSDTETPADDLRSLLSASFDEAEKPIAETPAAETSKPEVATDAPAAQAKDGERERGADGKFAKKADGEVQPDAKAEKPAAETKPADEKPDDKLAADKKPDDKTDELLSKWSASDKAMFKLQSPEAQEFLLRRHKAMESDYTKKTAAIAGLKTEYEPVQQMFAPYVDVLKQKGLTPQTVIRRWADVETALANGRGVDIISGLVRGYNIDKGSIARALGFTSSQSAAPSTDQTTQAQTATDPAASAAHQPIHLPPELTEELRQLRARLDAQEHERRSAQTQAASEREAKVETEITTFKSAANDKGELLHPYYEEVEPAMIALAQSYVASKQPIPVLTELYETAVWANPSTRAAMLASQKAQETAKASEEARAKAASARKAASSVTGAPGSGQASRQVRSELSLREQLEEAAANG